MTYNKKIYIVLSVLVVLAGILVGQVWFGERVAADGFQGQLQEVMGNSIFISGAYLDGDIPLDPTNRKRIEILVGPNTKFTKTVEYLLPMAEVIKLQESGQNYKIEDLKREKIEGSLADIVKAAGSGIPVTARVKKGNIYGKTKFKVDTIDYFKLVNPDRPGL